MDATEAMPHAESSSVIPAISLDALFAARDRAQAAYVEAKRLFDEAAGALAPFGVSLPGVNVEFPGSTYRDLRDEHYATAIANEVDRFVWVRLFALTNIDTIMDHRTRNELFARLHKSRAYAGDQDDALPPLTRENVEATIQAVHDDRLEYFERCVEAIYRSLSWEHRTNEPGRIKDKLIITGAFYTWSRSMQGDEVQFSHHESLHDLERVVLILDGQAPATHETGVRSLGAMKWGKWYDVPGTTGEPVLRVKNFRKGTTHIRIVRQELADDMNRIMARRFPGAIHEPAPSARERARQEPQRPRTSTALTEKAARQAYYTPEELADELVEAAGVTWGTRVLEPSAGSGAICRAVLRTRCENVTAIENDPRALELLELLAARVNERHEDDRPAMRIDARDFFDVDPSAELYDVVVMNPPFSNAQEVEHVLRAWLFVKPGGRLVSVMSRSAATNTRGRYAAFSDFLVATNAEVRPIESGTFRESGTNVETIMVVIDKEEEV